MKLLRLAPENTKFPFMRFRRVSYPFSAVLSILSVVLFLTVGMNFGIDFSGGTLIEVRAKSGAADICLYPRPRPSISNLGDSKCRVSARRPTPRSVSACSAGGDQAQQAAVEKVKQAARRFRLRYPPRRSRRTARFRRIGAVRHARRRAVDPGGAGLSVVPLRMAVRRRRDHRDHARSAADGRLLLASPSSNSTPRRSRRF